MAYESDRWLFESAVVTTAVAAGVLKSKKVGMIAVGLGVMMCNPGSMQKAAEEWLDENQGVLETVRTELTTLRANAERNGYWGGNNQGAYSLYSDATDTLDKLLAECAEQRKDSGETLQQSAKHGHGLTIFATAVEGLMVILMAWKLASRFFPSLLGKLTMDEAIRVATAHIHQKVMSVLTKGGVTAAAVAAILAKEGFSYESLANELEKMKTGPDFAQADMRYVKGEGLTMKNSGATAVKDPGVLKT